MYIVVTGAAGFIGSNLVKALNARGESQIIAVDNLQHADKFRNLVDCEIAEYFDQDEFPPRLADGDFDDDIAAVLHQGACSDTMETDGRYMLANNYRYSMVAAAALPGQRRSRSSTRRRRRCTAPAAVFARSPRPRRRSTSMAIRSSCSTSTCGAPLPERTAQIAGFRYFNVYGPREAHKGRMASVVWHFFNQYRANGKVQLFEGSGGYAAGEQRRDFISVDDVVKVNLDFLDHPQRSGIFNVGTGSAATFNAVAAATINACRAADGAPALSFDELHRTGAIEYIGFPPGLASRYQSFTQADLARLRAAGYTAPMATVEQGVAHYVRSLLAPADVNP